MQAVKISCPHCSRGITVDASKLPAKKVSFACPGCKGKVVVEEGEDPNSQLGMQLKSKVLLDVIDNSLEAKMMYTYTDLVKGDIELARHHVFALVPLIFGMQDYYESDDDFKKMIVDKKQEVGGE